MFPFWIATKPDGGIFVAPDRPRHVAAFVTAQGVKGFVEESGEHCWSFRLVGRANFHEMLDGLRALGLIGLCFDPGGERRLVPFEEAEQTPSPSALPDGPCNP
jgi:hypothetical protein